MSILNQSFQDLELIVVDDGSTDDTADRLAALGGLIHFIRREQNSGQPEVARNQGIAVARGELVAFLDDDDLWQPDKLDRQVALFDQDEELGFIYSDICFLYPDGSTSEPVLLPYQRQAERLFDHLITGCFIHPSTVVVRRELVIKLGWFDSGLRSQGDYDLWLRLAYTAKAGCVPAPLAIVRRHPSNLFRQREVLDYQNAIRILERLRATTPLSLRRQLLCRKTMARWSAHVGLLMVQAGDHRGARPYFLRSLRWNPAQRRSWTALTQSYFAGGP